MKNILASAARGASLALLCASCGPPRETGGGASPSRTLAVTDAAGRAVRLDHPPRRISIAGKASFMIENAAYLFPEARDRGLDFLGSQAPQRADVPDFLSLVAPGRDGRGTFTGVAGIEEVAATRPDVVLMKSSDRRAGDAMHRVGLPVVFLDLETPAQYERDLAILGQLLAAPDRAGELIGYYRGITRLVADRTAALPETDRPRALLLQYTDRGGAAAFSVPPPDWIQTELVERAGAVPVWKEAAQRGGWTLVNLEQIAVWDPDFIFVVRYHGDPVEAVEALRSDSRWRAVRDRRMLAFPGDFCSWDQPDPRWGLGLLWLATRLHPDRFADVDLAAEIFRFYALYGLDEPAVREHVLPLLPETLAHAAN